MSVMIDGWLTATVEYGQVARRALLAQRPGEVVVAVDERHLAMQRLRALEQRVRRGLPCSRTQ